MPNPDYNKYAPSAADVAAKSEFQIKTEKKWADKAASVVRTTAIRSVLTSRPFASLLK